MQLGGDISAREAFNPLPDKTLRISTHASLQYHIKQLRRANPQVDIIFNRNRAANIINCSRIM